MHVRGVIGHFFYEKIGLIMNLELYHKMIEKDAGQ